MIECKMITDRAILLCHRIDLDGESYEQLERYKRDFCGRVFVEDESPGDDSLSDFDRHLQHCSTSNPMVDIFFCGDVQSYVDSHPQIPDNVSMLIVEEFSYNYDSKVTVKSGQLPLNIHGVGIFFERFCFEEDVFEKLTTAHEFQGLKESDKETMSYRKGIYMAEVQKKRDETRFNLLRCSTNLTGPTEGMEVIDRKIMYATQLVALYYFLNPADLNHVLAQVYENFKGDPDAMEKDKKAKIKSHSDKTEDMPRNGLIAFCTFYSNDVEKYKPSIKDRHDRMYKNGSVLTKIRFRLKECVIDRQNLTESFTLTLYPGSLFLISLSTNRLYTHEIVPSTIGVDKLPTRLGYVIRCSHTEAIHKDGQTYIIRDGGLIRLKKPTSEDRERLKSLYKEENTTDKIMEYGDIDYSLNEGDYKEPI